MALVPWTYNDPHRDDSRSDRRCFSFCGSSLTLLQDFSSEISVSRNTHRKLWDGAFLLAKYLETEYPSRSALWRRRRRKRGSENGGVKVAELGAGCGLVGMVAFLLGAEEVRLTDLVEGLSHTETCLNANRGVLLRDESDATKNRSDRIKCDALDWLDNEETWSQSHVKHSYGCVFGSDIVYSGDEKVLTGLLNAIEFLAAEDALILLSYKPRGLGEDVFFSLAEKRGFRASFVDSSLHPREFYGSDYEIVVLSKT